MGLTGLIVRATVQLKRSHLAGPGGHGAHRRHRRDDAVLTEHDRRFGYTVAWSDSLARALTWPFRGHQRRLADLATWTRRRRPIRSRSGPAPGWGCRPIPARPDQPLHRGPGQRGVVPQGARTRTGELQSIGRSSIRWTDQELEPGYGPGGFRQYQYVVPFTAQAASPVVRDGQPAHAPSFVTVLKRSARVTRRAVVPMAAGRSPLTSRPDAGLDRLLDRLDRLVVEAGAAFTCQGLAGTGRGAGEMYPRWRSSPSCGPNSTRGILL